MGQNRRLIDADEIVKVAEHAYEQWNLAMIGADDTRTVNKVFKRRYLCKLVKAIAENTPAIDAVEVVRCGDCVYRKATEKAYKVFGWNCANKYSPCRNRIVSDADFCPYGERGDGV